MIETNIPNLSVEEIMNKIKQEVEKRKSIPSLLDEKEEGSTVETQRTLYTKSNNQEINETHTSNMHFKNNKIDVISKREVPFVQKEIYEYSDFTKYHDMEFIKNIYKGLLKREADISGFEHYLSQLRRGQRTKSEIISALRYSKEGRLKNVKLLGSKKRFISFGLSRIPILGKVYKWALYLITLPKVMQKINEYEAHTNLRFSEIKEDILSLQNAINDKTDIANINEIQNNLSSLNDYVNHKANITDLENIENYLQNTVDINHFDNITQNIQNELNQKANNEELTSLNQDIQTELKSKASADELQNMQNELNQKANNDELASLNQDIQTELKSKATIDELQNMKNELNQKADNDELTSLKQDMQSELKSKATIDELQAIQNELNQKVDNDELTSLNQDMQTELKSKASTEEVQDIQSELNQKADNHELTSLNQDIQSELKSKASTEEVQNIQSELNQKANNDELTSLNQDMQTELKEKTNHKEFDLYLQIVDHAKEYMKLSYQNMRILVDENKKRFHQEDLNQKELLEATDKQKHKFDAFYVEFENKFRGTREDIKTRVKVYLPYVENLPFEKEEIKALDVGCGRGEWLELLSENGYKHVKGLDINRIMVTNSQELGLDIVESDVIEYLTNQDDNSLNVITGFHIIEHLPFEILMKLFEESYRVLKKGGMVIFETPNPENVFVGSQYFYSDPTHINPIVPFSIQFIAEQNNFSNVEIKRLHKYSDYFDTKEQNEFISSAFYNEMDFSIIGYKK